LMFLAVQKQQILANFNDFELFNRVVASRNTQRRCNFERKITFQENNLNSSD